MKKTLLPLALMLTVGASAAYAEECQTTVTTITSSKLTVAAYDYPPFTAVAPDGKISGIDPTIIEKAAKENCLEVVALVMDPAATIQSVVSGKADVAIGSWNRTEKRAEVLGISAPTYLDPMGIFSKDGSDTVESLIGKNVGTVQGYQWVPALQALLGDKLKLYPTAVALAQDLEAGRIDVGVDAYNYGVYTQNSAGGYKGITIKLAQPDERVPASVEPAQAGILYTKGNESLGKALDASIEKQREDIVKDLVAAGFDKKVGDVGEPRLMK